MTRDELLARLASLRRATVGGARVPHKPLLLLWLFGRFMATGSTAVTYAEAEEPASALINEYGPPVRSPSLARQRAAMPFVHLERELWLLRSADGALLGPDVPERRTWLLQRGAHGQLRPEVEQLLSDPATLASAARLLLDSHFTPVLCDLISSTAGLDLATVESADSIQVEVSAPLHKRPRRQGFAEEVLRGYAYACAMCGFDGALGRHPVALQAAHVHWHSLGGPDDGTNGVALCVLHHVLLDLGVLGLTQDLRVRVSPMYVARGPAGQGVDALAGRELAEPRPGHPRVEPNFIAWHDRQVFKSGTAA